jgi:hypothetical protein
MTTATKSLCTAGALSVRRSRDARGIARTSTSLSPAAWTYAVRRRPSTIPTSPKQSPLPSRATAFRLISELERTVCWYDGSMIRVNRVTDPGTVTETRIQGR